MTKFWVPVAGVGSGNWNDTNHWATASGGAGGTGVPTASDDVVTDNLSSTGAYTITINATANCRSVSWGAPASGNLTLAGTQTLNVAGSYANYAGLIRTYTGAINFTSSTTGRTLDFAGVAMASTMAFNTAGGGWTLLSSLNNGTSTIQAFQGAIDTNGFTVTCGSMSGIGSAVRLLTLGASTWNCTSWATTGSNITLNAGTSTVAVIGVSNMFDTANLTFYNLSLSTAFQIGCPISTDFTVSNLLTLAGSSASTARLLLRTFTRGTTKTITAASVSITNVDFEEIVGAGAATWSGTSVGDCGGNSGITFTSPITCYWVHGVSAAYNWTDSTRWFTTSGGTTPARVPLCQDTARIDGSSIGASGKTIAIGVANTRLGTVDWTGVTNAPTFSFGQTSMWHGSMTLRSGMVISGTGTATLRGGAGTKVLTSAGCTFSCPLAMQALGTWQLGDALSMSALRTFTLFYGAFDTANNDMSVGLVTISGTTTRAMTLGTSTVSLTGNGFVWNAGTTTGLTFSGASSTIKFTDTSASAKTFDGGGLTYGTVWLSVVSSGKLTIGGDNTYTLFKCDARPNTLEFSSGQTHTFGGFEVNGTAGNLVVVRTETAASTTFSKASGTVSCDYLNLSYNDATGGASWYAGANSTNGGNNTGWTFTAPPTGGGNNPWFLLLSSLFATAIPVVGRLADVVSLREYREARLDELDDEALAA